MSKHDERELFRIFRSLVLQHETLVREHSAPSELMPWRDALDGFMAAKGVSEVEETWYAQSLRSELEALLGGYFEAHGAWMEGQKKTADDFNLIDVLQATHDEQRHSAMLAWLLDHRAEHCGTHAQGKLGFRLFLEELGLPADYALADYWVRREVVGDNARVDVEVAAYGRFIIHIENKLRAGEGDDQTGREWEDLKRRAACLGVTGLPRGVHALFLTPDARPPQNPNFKAVSWGRVARVLEEFSREAEPLDVRLFAAHYGRALRKYITTEYEIQESRTDEKTV